MLYTMIGHTAPPKAPPAELMASPFSRGPEPSSIIPTVVKRGQVGMKSQWLFSKSQGQGSQPEALEQEDLKPDLMLEDTQPQSEDKPPAGFILSSAPAAVHSKAKAKPSKGQDAASSSAAAAEDGKPEDTQPKPEDGKPEDGMPEDKETQTHTEWILVGDD